MSDNIKLIIEIPTDLYEITKAKVDKNMTHAPLSVSIAHGIPLDSVKAEDNTMEWVQHIDHGVDNSGKRYVTVYITRKEVDNESNG